MLKEALKGNKSALKYLKVEDLEVNVDTRKKAGPALQRLQVHSDHLCGCKEAGHRKPPEVSSSPVAVSSLDCDENVR